MTIAIFTAAQYTPTPPPPGATATGLAPHPGHPVGNALRAVKVFVSTAFRVAVLGEFAEEADVKPVGRYETHEDRHPRY